jgi:S-disulfanyl-L-cysteine oxidoreductase SoxD
MTSRARLLTAGFVSAMALSAAILGRQTVNGQSSNRTTWDGVFSEAQAERGQALFVDNCSECHGLELQGGDHKPLKGDRFWTDWQETTVDYLLRRISRNMPYSDDGSLAGTLGMPVYLDIVAHILKTNGFPAGTSDLTAESSVGVQIVKKGGPSELPSNAFVHVVGCLEKGPGVDWTLANGSRPARVLEGQPPDGRKPLGDRRYPLKHVSPAPDHEIGHRVSINATLIGDGGREGLNVTQLVSIDAVCQ